MVKKDNPAGRLYSILDSAKKQPDKVPVRDAWKAAFGIQFYDEYRFYECLAMLKKLVKEVKDLIEGTENINNDLYMLHYSNIEAAVNLDNFSTQWINVKQKLSDVAMLNLMHCAETLSGIYGENIIGEDKLNDLDRTISEIFHEIENYNISVELKNIILDHLLIIRTSIAEYRIRGAKGIEMAVSYCIGSLAQKYDLIKEENKSGIFKKFIGAIAQAQLLATTALKMKELGCDIKELFWMP